MRGWGGEAEGGCIVAVSGAEFQFCKMEELWSLRNTGNIHNTLGNGPDGKFYVKRILPGLKHKAYSNTLGLHYLCKKQTDRKYMK